MNKTHLPQIQVRNDYLPNDVFEFLHNYCETSIFNTLTFGDKSFLVLQVPENIIPYFNIGGLDTELLFIRKAHNDFDTDWRIHADSFINGKRAILAQVLFITNPVPNGTAFWKHETHGLQMDDNASPEAYDEVLLNDSNNLDVWEQQDFINNIPNRLLTYKANLFHSKFPNQIEQGERIVLVAFYT